MISPKYKVKSMSPKKDQKKNSTKSRLMRFNGKNLK